ncbi:hypothetical protein ABE545_10655 [Sphingobacterium faecium]|jgi:hypothetical protein|uniref:hypothetical protein n=1 Tax=Sphingobacterium faecium TaxID=34087 RepID=UPI003207AB67
MIRHLGVDPLALDDEDWARLVNEWLYIQGKLQEVQANNTRAILEDVLYTIVNRIYGNKN